MSASTIATVPATTTNVADAAVNAAIAAKVAAPVKAAKPAKVVVPRTTKALIPLTVGAKKMAASTKAKDLKVEDSTVKVVRTANSGLRIDHSNCKHETSGTAGKKARAACRARVEKSLKK